MNYFELFWHKLRQRATKLTSNNSDSVRYHEPRILKTIDAKMTLVEK